MITKADCLSILVKLEKDRNINVDKYVKQVAISREVPLEVLKFIADNRGLEIGNFYEVLRKSHNKKKSPLYTNILKEVDSPEEIALTLSCLLTQILLYGKKLENQTSFYKEARAEEITRAIDSFFDEGNWELGKTVLRLVKSDILVLEYLNGRRELE